jgi:hypothetical protein
MVFRAEGRECSSIHVEFIREKRRLVEAKSEFLRMLIMSSITHRHLDEEQSRKSTTGKREADQRQETTKPTPKRKSTCIKKTLKKKK